jgi:type I restriction enzyme M protein
VYALPNLDKHNLGELINLISGIGLGTKEHRDKDTLGRVYEYFLSRFASAEGKGGGEFYTPKSVVRTLVEMLEPYKGRVYDPCCGSGGMFVQSLKFIDAHNGRRNAVTIYGQESNRTTWRMARMNMAIRGIEAKLGSKHADSFHSDQHPDLRADFVMANPPFNVSKWGGERLLDDGRWRFGTPPTGNANFAWVQHIVHHLAPSGIAGVVLANGSMSSMTSGEGDIRQRLVEADLLDCMVALPQQLFYATAIPVCLWILARNKAGDGLRNRVGESLFIDARGFGSLETRTHRVLSVDEIDRISGTYHAWRKPSGKYEDVSGFCKSVTTEEIRNDGFILTPGRFVGAEPVEDDGEPYDEKMRRLRGALSAHFAESSRLETRILEGLELMHDA